MVRRTKPFEQYSTRLPDGRAVVEASAAVPVRLTFWKVGTSRADVLGRLRDRGLSEVHVTSSRRPGHALADLAAADPAGLVFAPGFVLATPAEVYPSALLPGHLADPARPLPGGRSPLSGR
jgi:hypothetical protein